MDVKELETTIDAAVEVARLALSEQTNTPHDAQVASLILTGAMLLKEFLVDHKRGADALEKLASDANELDQYRRAFGSMK